MKFFVLYVLGGIFLIQIFSVEGVSLSSAPTDTSRSSAFDEAFNEGLDIVGLCTDIPTIFFNLMMAYVNLSKDNAQILLTNLPAAVQNVKNEINTAKKELNAYTEVVSKTDNKAVPLQNQMISALKELDMASDELYAHLINAAKTNEMGTVAERVKMIETQINPAIIALRESCIAETKDILRNVIDSIESTGSKSEYNE